MATNSIPPEISGPRKRKPSTKASTNGDPQEVQKRQKSGTVVKKTASTPLTQKKDIPVAPDRASAKNSGKKPATAEIDSSDSDLDDNSEDLTSIPLNHVLKAAGKSDGNQDPAPELIIIDDDNNDEPNLEAPEESAEAEMGKNCIFWYQTELITT